MNPSRFRHTCLRKLASSVLFAVMLYQLGACPCGCLEHNFWIQLVGIGDHQHQAGGAVPTQRDGVLSDADHHDCSGEPRPQYLDSARSSKVVGAVSTLAPTFLTAEVVWQDQLAGEVSRFRRSSDSLGVARAPTRPALQVYRL